MIFAGGSGVTSQYVPVPRPATPLGDEPPPFFGSPQEVGIRTEPQDSRAGPAALTGSGVLRAVQLPDDGQCSGTFHDCGAAAGLF